MPRLRTTVPRVLRSIAAVGASSSGATLAILAIFLPLSMGFAALATDAALWQTQRRDLQMAADAAAISGAMEMARSGHTTEEIHAAAEHDAALNGYTAGGDTTITVVADEGEGTVQVVVRQDAPTFFVRMVFDGTPQVSGHATARAFDPLHNACILALDPTAPNALSLDSNANVVANGCNVHVNSNDAEALSTSANSDVTAEEICTAGGYSGNGYSPLPDSCDPIPDPLAGLEEPSVGACDETDFETSIGTHTLSPGVYCGGISAFSNAQLNFQPGTYIIKDGPLHLDSNVVANGDGVTFFFTGTDAVIDLNSNVELNISAPTSGEFAGMAIIEDDDNPELQSFHLDSNSDITIEGTVYLPNGRLDIDSNSGSGGSTAHTTIIARQIHLDANANLEVNAFSGGAVPPPSALNKTVALIK